METAQPNQGVFEWNCTQSSVTTLKTDARNPTGGIKKEKEKKKKTTSHKSDGWKSAPTLLLRPPDGNVDALVRQRRALWAENGSGRCQVGL